MKMYILIVLGIILFQVGILYIMPTDSSDKSRWIRSGFNIYIDNSTGVNYVGKIGIFSSTLTPRLNKDGSLYINRDNK